MHYLCICFEIWYAHPSRRNVLDALSPVRVVKEFKKINSVNFRLVEPEKIGTRGKKSTAFANLLDRLCWRPLRQVAVMAEFCFSLLFRGSDPRILRIAFKPPERLSEVYRHVKLGVRGWTKATTRLQELATYYDSEPDRLKRLQPS